jgi:hypothetical protein
MRTLFLLTTALVLSSMPAVAQLVDPNDPDYCKKAGPLERRTAAGYETCTDEGRKSADDLRHRLEGNFGIAPAVPPDDSEVTSRGRQHQENERRNIESAKKNDPRSSRSTITGPIHHNTVRGGGTAPTYKVSRPSFLGGSNGGARPSYSPPPYSSSPEKGGVGLPSVTQGREGHLGVDSIIDELMEKQK